MEKSTRISAVKADLPRMGNRVLLVEGVDDWHSFNHLVNAVTGRFPSYELGYCVNDEGVLDTLSAVTEASCIPQKVLGAVLDADSKIRARIRSLQGRLGSYYMIPSDFPADGLIVPPTEKFDRDRLPLLGLWLMPDNMRDGIFEDLLRTAMAADAESYIAQVVDQAKVDGMAGYRNVERSKAIVRTHMAWQNPNLKSSGEAIGARQFSNLLSASKPFLKWLDALFNPESNEGKDL